MGSHVACICLLEQGNPGPMGMRTPRHRHRQFRASNGRGPFADPGLAEQTCMSRSAIKTNHYIVVLYASAQDIIPVGVEISCMVNLRSDLSGFKLCSHRHRHTHHDPAGPDALDRADAMTHPVQDCSLPMWT